MHRQLINGFLLFLFVVLYSGCRKEILLLPANNAKMHINNLQFSWSGVHGGRYLVEIASDNAFVNIMDSVNIDSTHYFSRLQYTSQYPQDFPYTVTKAPNYIMGQIYYWRVTRQSSPVSQSATQSFIIIDTRDSMVGNWSGTFSGAYSQHQGTSGDTTYQGSVVISKNADGSITTNGLGYDLYPSPANDFDFSNGAVYFSYGDYSGGDCSYNASTRTLVFSTGWGQLGGNGGSTFTATR